jgi:hypothetical protein
MRKIAFVALVFNLLVHPSSAEKRSVRCKTPAIAPTCLVVHGRLQYGNGTPALRLWHIGTTHEFGIFSGPDAEKLDDLDNEHPHLPANLQKIYEIPNPFEVRIYGDFEVCPLVHYVPGHMQNACIAGASHLTVLK